MTRVIHHHVGALAWCAIFLSACHSDADVRTAAASKSGLNQIRTRAIAQLDFRALPHTPDFLARVFRLPNGGWGVSSRVFAGIVQLFDSRGHPAGTLGRAGSGPGEFGGSVFGVTTGSELWIIDPKNARVSWYSDELELLGTRSLPDSYGRVFSVGPGPRQKQVLFAGFFSGGGSFAVITADGSADRIGGEVPETSGRDAGAQIQFAAAAPDGSIWTIAQADGSVRIHDSAGAVTDRKVLKLEQFDDGLRWGQRPYADAGSRPGPRPEALGAAVVNRLFIATILLADPNWSPDVSSRTHGMRRVGDTLVIAIDTSSGEPVAVTRLDDVCLTAGGSVLSCVDELSQSITLLEMTVEP